MSSVNPIKYPLDLTGTAACNRVANEPHELGVSNNRAFMPTYGPFFTKGLVVRNADTGEVLTAQAQYKAIQMIPSATLRVGQLICGVILVTDLTVLNVTIDYQVLGGDQSTSIEAIQNAIIDLAIDERPVRWGQIIGKPDAFPPTSHLHDAGDIYGFEYQVAALYAIRDAILIGDAAAHQELIDQFTRMLDEVSDNLDALQLQLTEHLADRENPHEVNKAQVGLGLVENYAVATQAEAEAGSVNNRYMTPLRVQQAIEAQVGERLTNHLADMDNPHGTTKAQVGLGSVLNYGLASVAEAQAGSVNNKYMTPQLVAAAITALAMPAIDAHINDLDNPHQTTKAQVGLGLVENYSVATTAEAQAGVVANKYMTPALVAAAITAQAGANLTAHVNNLNNPHQTTKAQVGLGSVLDYGLATTAEAQAGTSNVKYMTPQLVAAAITSQAVTPLTGLINAKISTGSNAQLAQLTISTNGLIYQSGTEIRIRNNASGTVYWMFQADGTFRVNNGRTVSVGGFQPSDRRLKTNIKSFDARPLWRGMKYRQWDMIETGEHQVGLIAQDLRKLAPDRIYEYEHDRKRRIKRLSIDTAGTALEMAYAAGSEVDRLRKEVESLQRTVTKLLAAQ